MAKMSQCLTLLLILISSIMIHHLPLVSSKEWCVASLESTDEDLKANIDFGCSQVDCKPIQPGGSCFNPNTLINHASYVMNAYYQRHGRVDEACNVIFVNTGIITAKDPSYGRCVYGL
ncbi:Glucan endo-1,3-beta-glucosidase [Cardamine amara subsp. amara]|uniref:Glucan endo-1,3-beta-glucosidase n=1 Tax=Cardamine amara subsp. amara TaxID=228776 RepID=A0ABD1AA75_CARAN